MQLDLRTLFVVLVTLYACLGLVCLFLPYRLPGSHAVAYWGCGLLALAAGFGGMALRGMAPDFFSVIVAGALILLSLLFAFGSVRQEGTPGGYGLGGAVIAGAVLLLAYYTYVHPDAHMRVAIVTAGMVILLVRPLVALVNAAPGASRRARLFTAACLGGAGLAVLGMLLRAGLSAQSGAGADFLAPDHVHFTYMLGFGALVVLATLGVVWIEVEQLQADLERLAMIDPLTSMLNRRAFMLECEREISRCMREKTGLALAIFDLDHFKDVNDNYGHLVGDKVLRQVADKLRASLRGHDVLGRYGGEEFALLMPGADAAAAVAGTERARLAVGAKPIQAEQLSIPVTLSAGIATFGAEGSDWENMLRSADGALYEAKRSGRNRVVVAEQAPRPAAQNAAALTM